MEASEQDIELGGGVPPEADPFADVGAPLPDEPVEEGLPPEGDPLPPGVQPGTLGGENPSEMEPIEEPPAVEPEPEGISTEETTDAEVPPELQAEPEAEEPLVEEEPEVETPVPSEETEAESPPPSAPSGAEGNEQEDSPQETPVQDDEPEKPKAKKKAAKKKAKAKKKNGERGYVILIRGEGKGQWVEAFEGPKDGEPFVLPARNGTIALRRAYRKLTEDEDTPGTYTLLPVPEAYYNPKTVAGRVHKQTAISIG